MPIPSYTKRIFRKQVLLGKIESAYGTDSVPVANTNAIMLTETTFTPIEGEEVERDYYLPWLGHQGVIPVGLYARLEFSIDMAGSGAKGTAPAYGPLLRACGLAQTIVADTSVTYTPVAAGFEALSLYFNMDGVRHVLLGARGTFTIEPSPLRIPRFRFTMTGLLGAITDVALPTPTLTPWNKAKPVSKALTTMTLHGNEQVAESFSLDLGAQVEPRMLIGEESIQIVDRKTRGSAVVEATPLSVKNWFSIYQAETLAGLSFVHGTADGYIVEVAASNVQIGRPTYGQTQQIVNTTLPLMFVPSGSGNDDFSIIVR